MQAKQPKGDANMPNYIVIENTPGYLPDDDEPFVTDDYSSAVAYMNERVEEFAEFVAEGEGDPDISWGLASQNNYAAAYVVDTTREHDLGRWFSVELCEDDDS